MSNIGYLTNILLEHFPVNLVRVNFIALFTISLLKVKTVNLAQVALAFNPKAKVDSNYRRLQRFFADFNFGGNLVAFFVVNLFFPDQPLILTMDRTNWKFGRCNINILMLGIVYNGTAIPLKFIQLAKFLSCT